MIAVGEALNRSDGSIRNRSHARDTGSLGLSIDQHRAGAALSFTAAVLAARQIEILAQHREQTGLRNDVDSVGVSINREMNRSHSELQSGEDARRLSMKQLRK